MGSGTKIDIPLSTIPHQAWSSLNLLRTLTDFRSSGARKLLIERTLICENVIHLVSKPSAQWNLCFVLQICLDDSQALYIKIISKTWITHCHGNKHWQSDYQIFFGSNLCTLEIWPLDSTLMNVELVLKLHSVQQ